MNRTLQALLTQSISTIDFYIFNFAFSFRILKVDPFNVLLFPPRDFKFGSAGQVTSMLIISKVFAVLGRKSANFCILLPTFLGLFIVPVVKTRSFQQGLSRNVGKQLPTYAS